MDETKETLDVMKLKDKDKAVYNRRVESRRYKKSLLSSAKAEGKRKREIALIYKNGDLIFVTPYFGRGLIS